MTLQAISGPAKRRALRRYLLSIVGGLALVLGLGAVQPAIASTTTLTFDEYANGTDITNQYQSLGVMATGVNVLDAIFSPWPANTGANLAAAPTGILTFLLDSSITGDVTSVSSYVSGTTSIGIYAYDIGGSLVGQSLTPGATDNMFLSVTSAGNPIASVTVHDGGSNFLIDTLTFTSVPEPATAWLVGFGLIGLLGVRRRKETT